MWYHLKGCLLSSAVSELRTQDSDSLGFLNGELNPTLRTRSVQPWNGRTGVANMTFGPSHQGHEIIFSPCSGDGDLRCGINWGWGGAGLWSMKSPPIIWDLCHSEAGRLDSSGYFLSSSCVVRNIPEAPGSVQPLHGSSPGRDPE